jgi:Na+/H+ antiporter NhaD/arsenite permease-like protein
LDVKPAGIFVFALTYVLISARQLRWLGFDRPAGALFGAVLAVALGVLSPREALGAVDGPTIVLLFGVMGMGAFLALDGGLDQLGAKLSRVARTPQRLLGLMIWSAGALSALVTNDAVCVLGTPLVVQLIRRHRLPPLPFLLGLATAANTGSVATLVGNPQNMLCANLAQLSYRDHLLLLGPVAVLGLALNHGLVHWLFRKELAQSTLSEPAAEVIASRAWLPVLVNLGVAVACILGADLAWAAVGGFVTLMLLYRRDTTSLWSRIDWSLLLFFSGLFVVVAALMQSGLPDAFFSRFPLSGADPREIAGGLRLSGIFLFGSNVVSNVPFIVLVSGEMNKLSEPRLAWELLAMASTFAGNLTLLGSVANLIVAEGARELGGIGFWTYLRVGLPLALTTTLLGTLWLLWWF